MKFEELTQDEFSRAQTVEMVVADNGDGTFSTLKDRDHDLSTYTAEELIAHFRSVATPANNSVSVRSLLVLWVKA